MNDTIRFDWYQRYRTIQNMVETVRAAQDGRPFTILEVGANAHGTIHTFLPQDQITRSDLTITPEMQKRGMLALDATNMPSVADGAYDLVIATDVLEHVPPARREAFLKETLRVSRIGVLMSFPMGTPENRAMEERLRRVYKELTGRENGWVKEHAENGLPEKQAVLDMLSALGAEVACFERDDAARMERLIDCHFLADGNPCCDQKMERVDRLYMEDIYDVDCGEHNYHAFVAALKIPELSKQILKTCSVSEPLDPEQLKAFEKSLWELDRACLNSVINTNRALRESLSWRITAPLRALFKIVRR